jgi:hypothetical protein
MAKELYSMSHQLQTGEERICRTARNNNAVESSLRIADVDFQSIRGDIADLL